MVFSLLKRVRRGWMRAPLVITGLLFSIHAAAFVCGACLTEDGFSRVEAVASTSGAVQACTAGQGAPAGADMGCRTHPAGCCATGACPHSFGGCLVRAVEPVIFSSLDPDDSPEPLQGVSRISRAPRDLQVRKGVSLQTIPARTGRSLPLFLLERTFRC